jgi:hypothetical protein
MPITRTPIIDDDGSGTTGTTIDNAWKQEFYDQIDALAGSGSCEDIISATGGAIALGAYQTHVVTVTAGSPVAVNFTGGLKQKGERIILRCTNVVTVAHAPGANGFYNIATSAPTPIAAGGCAIWQYTNGAYVLIAHEQGAYIAPPYNAANFTGLGSMTWTVEAADVLGFRYKLKGKEIFVSFQLATTSIGGTLNIGLILQNTGFGSFTLAATGLYLPVAYLNDAGTLTPGYCTVASASAFQITKQTAVNFAASTNGTYAYGTAQAEVN